MLSERPVTPCRRRQKRTRRWGCWGRGHHTFCITSSSNSLFSLAVARHHPSHCPPPCADQHAETAHPPVHLSSSHLSSWFQTAWFFQRDAGFNYSSRRVVTFKRCHDNRHLHNLQELVEAAALWAPWPSSPPLPVQPSGVQSW